MRLSNVLSTLVLLAMCNACISETVFTLPEVSKEVVVNGLLSTDDSLNVQLSWSGKVNEVEFLPVRGAQVSVLEDKTQRYVLLESADGLYYHPYKPKTGSVYELEVLLDGHSPITAVDSIPGRASFKAYLTEPIASNFNGNQDLILEISEGEEGSSRWVSVNMFRYSIQNRDSLGRTTQLSSNSIYLDDFNSEINNASGLNDFKIMSRIIPGILNPVSIKYNIVNQLSTLKRKGERLELTYLTASLTFDKYLKSAITAYTNGVTNQYGKFNNPFGQYLVTYSNVQNGLGIWAAGAYEKVILVEGTD